MDNNERYDFRLAPLTLTVKSMASPQGLYYDKAKNVRAERGETGVVTLYRHEDLLRVNRHPAVLGVGGRGGMFGNDQPLIPLEVDGESHRMWRRLLDPLFAPKQVARLEGAIRQRAAQLMDAFAGDGVAELYQAYCVPLPCLTFLEMLGAPTEDLGFFLQFKDGVLHPKGESLEELDANMAASGAKLLEYFTNYLAERRAEDGQKDDIIAVLLRSEVDGKPITDAELLNMLFLLMFAGLDTVTASMSCMLAWLGQHPEERRRLVEDHSLIPAAVEELLRYESPVPTSVRYATEDIDLGDGLVVKDGDAIHVSFAAANVDPQAYPDPLQVVFGRGRVNHLAFASGTHRCLGSHLARLELRIALDEFLTRIPDYVVDAKDGLAYDNLSVRAAEHLPIVFAPNPVLAEQR